MKAYWKRAVASLAAMRTVRAIAGCGMLLAAQVVLSLVASIPIGPSIRIGFGYLASAATGYLFGPFPAMINGALCDLIVFAIRPTGPYFPGFTVSAALTGLIFGLVFYGRARVSLRHVLIAKALNDVIVNLGLNTLWLAMLYGNAFIALLPARALKNLIQYPVDALLLLPLLAALMRLRGRGGESS